MGVLSGKTVVVTGSTRGIGRAIAEACGEAGANVVVSSSNALAVEETTSEFAGRGFTVTGIKCDVKMEKDIERLLESAIAAYGRVDIWMNNAGLSQGVISMDEMTAEETAEIVSVNILGVINGSRTAITYMKENGGILINMTGKGADGKASPYTSVYAMTKAAVTSLTKSLAEENKGLPISIHLLSPGMVATDFYRDLRVGKNMEARAAAVPKVLEAIGMPPEDSGKLVVEIASQMPGRITGKTYNVFRGAKMFKGILRLMMMRAKGEISS